MKIWQINQNVYMKTSLALIINGENITDTFSENKKYFEGF